jgi:P27 family predicted phage terminase small subunit
MDHLLIEMVCVTQDQIARIEKELELNGRYYKTPQGQILAHPAVGDLRNLKAATVSWLSALCFSPSDRKQLGIMVDTASSDALAEFKKRAQANRDNL